MMTAVYIVLGIIVIYIMYKFLFVKSQPNGYKDISAAELTSMMKNQKVNLVDVRTKSEMNAGVIGKPQWLELNKNFKAKTARLDKRETYVIYCRSGRRSAIASQMLSSFGFEHIFNLTGGYGAFKQK